MSEIETTVEVMTVAPLRDALAEYPDDLPVVMSGDPEGNRYGEFGSATSERWWSEQGELAYSDEDGGDPVVCLWPAR
jgi:hypothetical protein